MRAFSPSDHQALISIDHAEARPASGGVLIVEHRQRRAA
jgi:hypothetical protein